MLLEGAMSLSRYACSSCDDHWPCNGFTTSTVPATGLRAVGLGSAYSHLVFLLVIPVLGDAIGIVHCGFVGYCAPAMRFNVM